MDRNKDGYGLHATATRPTVLMLTWNNRVIGVFWKFARIGERLSPFISICCVLMAVCPPSRPVIALVLTVSIGLYPHEVERGTSATETTTTIIFQIFTNGLGVWDGWEVGVKSNKRWAITPRGACACIKRTSVFYDFNVII